MRHGTVGDTTRSGRRLLQQCAEPAAAAAAQGGRCRAARGGDRFYATTYLSDEVTLDAWIAFRVLRGKAMGPSGDRAANLNRSE